MDLFLTGSATDYIDLSMIAATLDRYFGKVRVSSATRPEDSSEHGCLRLHVTNRRLPQPYLVKAPWGVVVSSWGCHGIRTFAGIDCHTYVVLCSLMGISQWRALTDNSVLRPEDFEHPPSTDCLYSMPGEISEFALRFEDPRICGGCVDFYHCLGADTEIVALQETLAGLRQRGKR